jgi:HK97 family phage portal protein
VGLFDRFRKPQNAYEVVPDLADEFRGQPIHYDIRKLAPSEMWETQPHLRTVVSFLARNVAQLGLHSFERQGETDRVRDRASVAARVLRRPNSETTTYELIFSLVGDLALYDVAYWWIAADGEAPAGKSIVRFPPEWVKPKNADAFRRASFDVKAPGGKAVNFPASEVLAFHGYNPTDARDGSTPISALKGVLQEQLQSSLYRQQVWKNGGRVSAVLKRPQGAQWSPEARDRFREDWYSLYTGSGPKAGGTPILEDGMELQRIDFSAKDQEYVEGAKLSFATVCSAYHVNPTMVGLLDNANYSNVREFRRMLYGDTLGPLLAQIEDRLNTFLLPMLGMDDATNYVEFNLAEKLQGSFEEQAAVMSTLVGRPIMSADEGRARFNLPAMGGDAESLVTPLNVLIGGQASPRDTGSQNETGEPKSYGLRVLDGGRLKARPPETFEEKHVEVLAKFFRRQGAAVLGKIGNGDTDWWDGERWDKELAEDLLKLGLLTSKATAEQVAAELDLAFSEYDEDRTIAFLTAVAERQAGSINTVTERQVSEQLDADEPDPKHVFNIAEDSRTKSLATSLVTTAAGFGARELAQQLLGEKATKTWVTGSNPRPAHARMDGETVPVGEVFSNGAQYPGDGVLDADDTSNCNCSLRVSPVTP